MIFKTYLADAFNFPYKNEIKQVDLIVSSPPFFNPYDKSNNFGETVESHYRKLFTLFNGIYNTLYSKYAFIHVEEKTFWHLSDKGQRITKENIKGFVNVPNYS